MEYIIGFIIGGTVSIGLVGVGYYLGCQHTLKRLEIAVESGDTPPKNTRLNRIKNLINKTGRKQAVYVPSINKEERNDLDREEGWDDFDKEIEKPASEDKD